MIPYSALQRVVVCPAEGAIITGSEEESTAAEVSDTFLNTLMGCVTQVMSENVSAQESANLCVCMKSLSFIGQFNHNKTTQFNC